VKNSQEYRGGRGRRRESGGISLRGERASKTELCREIVEKDVGKKTKRGGGERGTRRGASEAGSRGRKAPGGEVGYKREKLSTLNGDQRGDIASR